MAAALPARCGVFPRGQEALPPRGLALLQVSSTDEKWIILQQEEYDAWLKGMRKLVTVAMLGWVL